jgi:hypothetical protein
MKKTASDYHKARRGNCAQAVAFAWGSTFRGGSGVEAVFAGHGGGRAPGGLCGAVHASCTLAGAAAEESIKQAFAAKTGGHLTCKAIRAAKTLPCSACVEVAAELLDDHARKSRPRD